MPQQFTSERKYTLAGIVFNSGVQALTGPGIEIVDQNIPIAWAGSLSTRTDNDTGTVTMNDAGHLITTGSRVDVYWNGGQRRGMTVGTVAGTSVPIDLGSGTNLPNQGTAIIVATAQQFAFSFSGSNIAGLACASDARGTIVICSGTVTEELSKIFSGPDAYGWTSSDSEANPIVGDTITFIYMSHADTAIARGMRAAVLKTA